MPSQELLPKGDKGWRMPSSLVKTLAWNLKNYSTSCKIEHCGENSSWLPTEVDESKVSKYGSPLSFNNTKVPVAHYNNGSMPSASQTHRFYKFSLKIC